MSKNSIIVIIVVIILGFIGYKFYFVGTSADSDASMSVSTQTVQTEAGQKILKIIKQMANLDINTEILKSDLYTSLVDTPNKVFSQKVGRSNPFSPLGQNIVNTATLPNPSVKTGPVVSTSSRPIR